MAEAVSDGGWRGWGGILGTGEWWGDPAWVCWQQGESLLSGHPRGVPCMFLGGGGWKFSLR